MKEKKSGGRIKRGSGTNRGYIGYHTTWDEKRVFLRSRAEFIYARMLDYEKIPYKLECVTYEVDGRRYKPDFFIFDENYTQIQKIVEIKGQDAKRVGLEYKEKYGPFFEDLGIEYETVWAFDRIITKYNLREEIKQWVEKSLKVYDFLPDSRGENNPMYGKKHFDSTKKLISEKAKKRYEDVEYRETMRQKQKAFYLTEEGEKRKQYLRECRWREAEERKVRFDKINPEITKICIICGKEFTTRESYKNEFCTYKCRMKWKRKNIEGYGKHKKEGLTYKNNLQSTIRKILVQEGITIQVFLEDVDQHIRQAKESGILHKNKGITLKTLEKYNLSTQDQWEN